tara:strand:- start:28813 stop:29019 length:207 start_codon:yes stop_codon:yes gene_type:complete
MKPATTKTETAAEVVQRQHTTILRAIELLQADLDAMTGTTDPETTDWRDVSRYAHTTDAALCIIERLA